MHVPLADADLAALRASADQCCALLKALANTDRLLLLCQLVEGECNVGELEAQTGIRQPSLSQQLGVLRDEGLVATRRSGKFIYYSMASNEVRQIMKTLSTLYCGNVEGAASDRGERGVGPVPSPGRPKTGQPPRGAASDRRERGVGAP